MSHTVCNTKNITVDYKLTDYSKTLSELITAMCKWGKKNRQKIILFLNIELESMTSSQFQEYLKVEKFAILTSSQFQEYLKVEKFAILT
ncbi:winged helix-turn-helix transcriptional regulator [Sphingobacterium sp. JUb78]|uniref:winged helix-turn-helix transcriptional regulator n=1 Tax=Sphingobacterium sp. JUb78 TaxID=2485111 RepID=UPI003977E868